MKSAVGGGREYPAADEREKLTPPLTPPISKKQAKNALFLVL
jgi:hypothetical protein